MDVCFLAKKRVERATIKGASSAAVYSGSYILAYSYDQKGNTFFHAQDSRTGWAKYEIAKASVRLVRLQNRPDCCCKFTQTSVFYLSSSRLTHDRSSEIDHISLQNSFNQQSDCIRLLCSFARGNSGNSVE